jgi:DNA-binding XRE family transcriptional regulator
MSISKRREAFKMSTGEKVRQERIGRGLSAEVMASVIETSVANYYKKEAGDIKFDLVEARTIARYFGKAIEDLFFEDEIA